MDTLVAAVLLGFAWRDPRQRDAQLDQAPSGAADRYIIAARMAGVVVALP